MNKFSRGLLAMAVASACASAMAQTAVDRYTLRIERNSLVETLRDFSSQTALQVIGPIDSESNIIVGPLSGTFTAEAALDALLARSDLTFSRVNERTIAITSKRSLDHAASGIPTMRKVSQQGHLNERHDEAHLIKISMAQETESLNSKKIDVQQTDSDAFDAEEVVVTGSHIRGNEPAGSKVIVIDQTAIVESGYGRVQDVLSTLTQNFKGAGEEFNQANSNVNGGAEIQFRGLGPGTTLTLVNGQRQPAGGTSGVFVDVSSIPLAAIERIEILTDGASAIYGSDAMGGVANIILRNDFSGAESRVRTATAQGEGDELQISQVMGQSWDDGNAMIGYQYYSRDAVPASSRDYTARNYDFTGHGGSDFRQLFQQFAGNPGTILDPDTFQPIYAIPAGQNGVGLQESDLIPGNANYTDNVTGYQLLPKQEMHSAFLSSSYHVTENWKLSFDGRYSARKMTGSSGASPFIPLFVPSSNPFYVNPDESAEFVVVSYDFSKDLGRPELSATTDTYSFNFGVAGELGGQWQVRFNGSLGRENVRYRVTNFLDAGSDETITAVYAALYDTNAATALNVFGGGSSNNPATLDAIRGSEFTEGTSKLWSTMVIADGPVIDMPGGSARLAIGADYRDETQSTVEDGLSTPSERHVSAAFAELVLPVVTERNSRFGIHRLDASLAGRYESYSDFGNTIDPKVGISYWPLSQLKLRGTWGTSFRAPPLARSNERLGGGPYAFITFAADPLSPSGASRVIQLFGNNEDLKEETATVWTAGLDFSPTDIPELMVSMTYYRINYRDKIEATFPSLQLEGQFAGLITRDPTQSQLEGYCNNPNFRVFGDCSLPIAAILDVRQRNTAIVKMSGIDAEINLGHSTEYGMFSYGVGGTYNFSYMRGVTESAPLIDVVDTVGNPLALRLRAHASVTKGQWNGGAVINHAGSYTDPGIISKAIVGSWTTADLHLNYKLPEDRDNWLGGTQISIIAVNVFDKDPPFVNKVENGIGYDGANATLLGRLLSLQLTKNW